MLVCDMEKYKRPALQQEPNVYLEPKWLRCPQCCSGLELIGPAHEELETPEAVLGAGIEASSYLAQQRKSSRPPTQAPRQARPRGRPRSRPRGRSCGRPRGRCRGRPRGRPRGGPRGTGRQTLQNLPNPQPPSKPSKHLPQQAPQGQGHFSIRPPRAKATAMAFYWLSKLPFASPQTLQTLQNPPNALKPSKHSKHHPKPSKPSRPGGML